ncbi:HAMP domain-containing histidine kinase [Cryptosporangium phraense]|uniref:histidine kinase n=2 Tax=Cryptosporangium phraense TaxID=2593070 RepID=A0A545AXZ3_9ACTN|nr:HAMP domain-containing histidine kinase [Cryptosporangium phraense]
MASWLAVAEIQQHQVQSELTTDADAIAAQPQQWLAGSATLPEVDGRPEGGHRGRHQLGPRWQILDAAGGVLTDSSVGLPISADARRVAAGQRRSVQEDVTLDGDSYRMLTVPATGGGAVQVAVNEDPGNNTLTMFGVALAVATLLGVGGAVWLGRVVARAGLRPVQELTTAVEEVAATTDLTRPVPVAGDDEIARLGRSVNTMLTAIESSRRAQRSLVEDAGHELRTPLTSIRTNIELLLAVERHPERAHRLPPEERANLLRDLDAQVAELATLTTELVDLAREDTTREEIEPVDLADVVAAAVNRVRIRAPGLTFTAELGSAVISGRPGELERMAVNVLDNAAKWSPPGGTVRTELRVDADGCLLTVTDDGPGIDPVDQPHVFERFYRATAARGTPGSGLGLAIVAQTAAQHGGTVMVDSVPPHGTVIAIRLPCARSSSVS